MTTKRTREFWESIAERAKDAQEMTIDDFLREKFGRALGPAEVRQYDRLRSAMEAQLGTTLEKTYE